MPDDAVVIRVLNRHRRWLVQLDGREDMKFDARGRGRAVEAALDLAQTVAPARVVVHTADGRVRRTITVGPPPSDGSSPGDQAAERAGEEA
jgi:hypothetical protein